ncbi:MAG: TonB-dependent receptor [Sedimentisphaerales bacterium]|nr:TonB-dependent receptor [Sedimentisphaerales bacterium]
MKIIKAKLVITRDIKAFMLVIMLFVTQCIYSAQKPNSPIINQDNTDISDLDITSNPEMILFLDIPEVVSGALTQTERRLNPSTVTTITKHDIAASGARSLNELLDITIPNLQIALHNWEPLHLGLRGVTSDLEDKYLLLVNGRVMNDRTHFGVLSERDLPMLTDIHHIDVIRGPGSALYGAGALAMVVNIITESGLTFEGAEITARMGAIEEFYDYEFKWGRRFDETSGLFLYAGMSDYLGADGDDSPVIYSVGSGYWGTGISRPGRVILPGDSPGTDVVNDRGSYHDRNRYKVHIQYTDENFDFWTRFTSGGEVRARDPLTDTWVGSEPPAPQGQGYMQTTFFAKYTQPISDDLKIDYRFSYDSESVSMYIFNAYQSFREDEYYGQILATYNPAENHSLALGGEWSHEEFGLKAHGHPDEPATFGWFQYRPDSRVPRWSTETKSVLTEWQWNIDEKWTTFLGGRIDWHTFTQPMYSPRFAIIHTPTEKDTIKFLWSQASRTNVNASMKINYDRNDDISDHEMLRAYELRYERQQNENLMCGGSIFYHDHDLIGWDQWGGSNINLGTLKSCGAELEAAYQTKNTKITLSHGWTKLINFRLADSNIQTFTSAEPYGYGNDFAAWHNHVSKLTARHQINEQIELNGAFRIYWGLPGGEDMAHYQNDSQGAQVWDTSYDRAFDPSFFLNLGASYKPIENLSLSVELYNILGWFDYRLNKYYYAYAGSSPGCYRSPAPAVGITLNYTF